MSEEFYRKDTAKSRYEKLASDRKPYTDRAEKNAKLTIPMVFPKETDNSNTIYETPYQSIGARGVNNLSSKLLLALFPPNEPFFRLSPGEDIKQQIDAQPGASSEIEAALGTLERRVTNYMETQRVRVTAAEGIIQLVVAGNVLFFLPPKEGGMRVYKLNSYVVQRDGIGNVLEIITKETAAYSALPPEAQSCIEQQDVEPDKSVEIYTHTYLEGDMYISYQEIEGKVVGIEQKYPRDKSPWIAVRLKKMDGEAYGRSFVDEYYGDLKTCETLSKAIAQVAAVASNIIYAVKPGSIMRISKLAKLQSGDFIQGNRDDVQAIQLDKTMDMQVVTAFIQQVESRLSYAFLLNSAVQRNAERVTAEEIRYVANELEDTIGGIYSLLSQEFQLPLVRCVMNRMIQQGSFPDLPQGEAGIEPTIITGLEALGRGHDLTKLTTFLQCAQQMPEAFARYVKSDAILSQFATAVGIDASSVIKTPEEVAQEQQAAQEAAMEQQAVGPMVQGAMR